MKIILLILLLINGCGIITKSNELTVKKEYFENGQLKSVYHYRNDMKHGEAIVYYPTGALKGEATFDNDKLEGIFFSYYENGNKEIQGSYANGILKGNWIKYYDNGVVQLEGHYKTGIKDGVWNLYLINGDILEETIYNMGIEYWYTSSFVLRAGYMYDYEGKVINPTFGAGIRLLQYGFDFGYTAGSQKQENPSRINTMFFSINIVI